MYELISTFVLMLNLSQINCFLCWSYHTYWYSVYYHDYYLLFIHQPTGTGVLNILCKDVERCDNRIGNTGKWFTNFIFLCVVYSRCKSCGGKRFCFLCDYEEHQLEPEHERFQIKPLYMEQLRPCTVVEPDAEHRHKGTAFLYFQFCILRY